MAWFKRLSSIGLATTILLSTPVSAMLSVPYGWYLELNGGSSHLSNKSNPEGTTSTQSGWGGNVNLGYKFMPFFAGELGVTRYTNTSIKASDTEIAQDKNYSAALAGKGIIPFTDSGFEAFAKLGVGRIYSSRTVKNQTLANTYAIGNSSNSATGLYLGLGGQYYFNPEFAVVGQWQRLTGNNASGTGDLYTIGVSFIFD
ncbi:MAG: outer membrane beta-barrel protein [Gammaproteobacteria bacterium]|nr:outer membrane beta-barrel protein [Gammaproteobacteria bacterium]